MNNVKSEFELTRFFTFFHFLFSVASRFSALAQQRLNPVLYILIYKFTTRHQKALVWYAFRVRILIGSIDKRFRKLVDRVNGLARWSGVRTQVPRVLGTYFDWFHLQSLSHAAIEQFDTLIRCRAPCIGYVF